MGGLTCQQISDKLKGMGVKGASYPNITKDRMVVAEEHKAIWREVLERRVEEVAGRLLDSYEMARSQALGNSVAGEPPKAFWLASESIERLLGLNRAEPSRASTEVRRRDWGVDSCSST